jgi:DNA modification methylase
MEPEVRETIFDVLDRESVHPFPARMSPSVALQVLSIRTKEKLRILDPMMGSGTVLALARAKGHYAAGVDIDPLAVLISRVWTTAIDKASVRSHATSALVRARMQANPNAAGSQTARDEETARFINYWFDARARKQLGALSAEISTITDRAIRDVLWCGFSRLIITKQAGASRAMDLSHSRPHRSFDRGQIVPFEKFIEAVERVLDGCLDRKDRNLGPAARAIEGDARNLPIETGSIDLVLTSPPYLNAIDYFRCSKFTLVWMGHSVGSLRKLRAHSVGSEVGHYVADDRQIRALISNLNLDPALSRRHDAILEKYVRDMRGCLLEVSRVLNENGRAIYVVGENTVRGTFVPNAQIVKALARSAGLRLLHARSRELPANRRYLPPPSHRASSTTLDTRMRREVVMTFRKSELHSAGW